MAQCRAIDADEETDDCADEGTDEDEDYVKDAEIEDKNKDDDNDDDEVEDTDDGDNEGDEDADGSKDGDGDEGEDGLKRGDDDDDSEDGVRGKGDDDGNAGKDKDRDGYEKLAASKKNKDGAEDVAPGTNKEEGHIEGETKAGDADDRKKGQLPDTEKTEDCPEGSKEQQEGQPPALAQSTPNQEEEAVGDYQFLARQATPRINEDVPTFNLGFDSTQETLEEVTITSKNYGSFTTQDYEWVGREADEAIALKALEDFERVQREADETTAKKASEDTTPVPHEYNKRVVKPEKLQRSSFIDYDDKKQFTERIEVVLNKKEYRTRSIRNI
ncbi:hypothetical protein E2562_022793 [Oryza meyeriana var. granulata]|uniref:Uncharacterized protein n=1 Tax=Oryza meyeriana var. granulata TaxID=110450 RepID=A0A6G1EYC3_9ORYZ|nr:hypothetical protein E2562_022793 [Oryza meyeriana var. granulata]